MTTLPLDLNIIGERWYVERTCNVVTTVTKHTLVGMIPPLGYRAVLITHTLPAVPLDRLWLIERVTVSLSGAASRFQGVGATPSLHAALLDVDELELDSDDDSAHPNWDAFALGQPVDMFGLQDSWTLSFDLAQPLKVPAGFQLRIIAGVRHEISPTAATLTSRVQATVLRRRSPAS